MKKIIFLFVSILLVSNFVFGSSFMIRNTSASEPFFILNGSTYGMSILGAINLNSHALLNIDWANSDDGSGSGLDADLLDGISSGSFFILSQSETVTGIPNFNGGTAGSSAPFTVDSTYKVSNLNADLLDGQSGAYYLDNTDTQDLGTSGNTITLTDGGSITAPYATNAGTLDSIDSTSFLRSDTADTMDSVLTFGTGAHISFGNSIGMKLDTDGETLIIGDIS